MVHKCNYCKQIKKCRKVKIYSDGAGVGYPSYYIASEFICKDCDEYEKELLKEREEQDERDAIKRLTEYIIRRDKKLKEINK